MRKAFISFWFGAILFTATIPVAALGEVRLGIALDRQEYALGQPVILGTRVENAGAEPFRDLTFMHPAAGFLSLELERNGVRVPWTGMRWTAAMEEGISLRPGEAVCEMTELGDWFGQELTLAGRDGPIQTWGLGPGAYTLRVRLSARTGIVRGLAPVFLDGGQLDFRVREESQGSASEKQVRDFTFQLKGGARLPAPAEKRLLLMRNLDSPFLYPLFRYLHLTEEELPTADLLALAEGTGKNHVIAAAMIHARCQLLHVGDSGKEKFVSALLMRAHSEEVRCTLISWLVKLRNKRYYTSFGP